MDGTGEHFDKQIRQAQKVKGGFLLSYAETRPKQGENGGRNHVKIEEGSVE